MYDFSGSRAPATALIPLSVHCPSACDKSAEEMINYFIYHFFLHRPELGGGGGGLN